MIDISKLNKAEVLCKLYNSSKVQGLGFLQARSGDLSIQEAKELLKQGSYFDYLYGKIMKVDIGSDELDEELYDRDNGLGAAMKAIFG